jgi:6-phosphogluconolactonase
VLALKKTMAYIGNFSKNGIYIYELSGGKFIPANEVEKIQRPGHLANMGNSYLYAALELESFNGAYGGAVAAFEIAAVDGSLKLLNTQPTHGSLPCNLCLNKSGKMLFSANYKDGKVNVFPIKLDGKVLPCSHIEQHVGLGPNAKRQAGPHAHCVTMTPDGKFLCVVDLGLDAVKLYSLNLGAGSLTEREELSLKLRSGCGPRHIQFSKNDNIAYLINEIANEMVTLLYSPEHGFKIMQVISTLPTSFTGESTAAAIAISDSGDFLYASNRGHDSITAFKIGSDGLLSLVEIFPCGGSWPRDIAISPDGNFLFCANELSNTITAFKIYHVSGRLEAQGIAAAAEAPTCIKFVTLK